MEALTAKIIGEQVIILDRAYCYRAKAFVPVDLGDVVISGIPCVDFSTYGKHAGLEGPTRILVVIWIRLMQIHKPSVIIIEEVNLSCTSASPLP